MFVCSTSGFARRLSRTMKYSDDVLSQVSLKQLVEHKATYVWHGKILGDDGVHHAASMCFFGGRCVEGYFER